MKDFLKLFLAVVFGLLFMCGILEVGLRTYQYYVKKIPFTRSLADYEDYVSGWQGKKIFGDKDTSRFKLFVIGDSYTNGVGADETRMYYRVLAKALDAELFIYGGSGYGSLQEYMILDQYIDQIKPNMILWQVCSNDFVNNSLELEQKSFSNNNHMVRPYLVNGRIEYGYPGFWGRHRLTLEKYSRLYYLVSTSMDALLADLAYKGVIKTVEEKMGKEGLAYKPFARAYQTTKDIAHMFKQRAGKVLVVAVTASGDIVTDKLFSEIFNQEQIMYINTPAYIVDEISRREDLSLGPRVGHWNAKGHLIFGTALTQEFLRRKGIVH